MPLSWNDIRSRAAAGKSKTPEMFRKPSQRDIGIGSICRPGVKKITNFAFLITVVDVCVVTFFDYTKIDYNQ